MRILQLTNKPIFPLVDGGCVAMHELSKLLLANATLVKNISISTEKHPFNLVAFPLEFQEKFQPEAVFIPTKISVFGALYNLVKGSSYNLSRFYSANFEQFLINHLKVQDYDVIVCESIYLLPYLEALRTHSKAKIIVRTHNVEHQIWDRLTGSSSFPKSMYLKKLSRDLKTAELNLLQKVDGILAISNDDKKIFEELGIKTKTEVIPVSIEHSEKCVNTKSVHFHHLGSMNWQPNIEAVHSLIHHIFPKIRARIPKAELHLAGSFFPSNIQTNADKGIFVHGFVEDRFQFIQDHGIQLVPLKSGSGVRIKLLESMAIGAPIITTKIGAEGIDLLHEPSMIIANNDNEFIEDAVELYKNAELRQRIGANAQKLIAKNYSFERINIRFIEFIKAIS